MLAISASPSLAQDFPVRLEEVICKTVNSPEFMKQGATLGFLPALPPSADFGKTIAVEDVEPSSVMTKAD
ncbi:MAG: hypothetical protein JJD98_05215 [Polaromonas sp.]|nr:hypothetical protein [Polaromonas sp.]